MLYYRALIIESISNEQNMTPTEGQDLLTQIVMKDMEDIIH